MSGEEKSLLSSNNDKIMDTFNELKSLELFVAQTMFASQGQCREYVVNELGKIKQNMRQRFNIVRIDWRENEEGV